MGESFAVVGPLAHRAGIESLRGQAVVRPAPSTVVVRPDRYTFASAADEPEAAAAMTSLRAQLGRSQRWAGL